MRVGVFVPTWGQLEGGAYTLENDLFDVLMAADQKSRHEFFGIVSSPPGAAPSPYRTINILEPHVQQPKPRMWLLTRVLRRVRRVIQSAVARFQPRRKKSHCTVSPSMSQLDDCLAHHGIEFVVMLNPYVVMLNPINSIPAQPYLTYVWDLEHRTQPFFPEVRGSNWRDRESHYRLLLGQATFIVTGTKEGAAQVERFFGVSPSRLRVIPYPTPRFALESSKESQGGERLAEVPEGQPFVFYPAQLWAHKNHVTALKAIRVLKDRHGLEVNLILVGADKGNWAHVQGWVRRLQLEQQVVFAGFVSPKKLRWLYLNALALLFPTFFGPDNLPPLEAFALGCPVIASDIAGAKEQLGDAAILCHPLDVNGFADSIARVANGSSLRTDLIDRGRRRAAKCTSQDAAGMLLNILDEFADVRDTWGPS